jgi:hypothetical protein
MNNSDALSTGHLSHVVGRVFHYQLRASSFGLSGRRITAVFALINLRPLVPG